MALSMEINEFVSVRKAFKWTFGFYSLSQDRQFGTEINPHTSTQIDMLTDISHAG